MLPSVRLLRAARVLLGWSQQELADASGVHQTVIGRIEAKSSTPRTVTTERLAKALEDAGIVFFSDAGMEGIKISTRMPTPE